MFGHGEETSAWGGTDVIEEDKDAFAGWDKFGGGLHKSRNGGVPHPIDAQLNRLIAKVLSRVAHRSHVPERQSGCVKTRFRGLSKNRTQLFCLFAAGSL